MPVPQPQAESDNDSDNVIPTHANGPRAGETGGIPVDVDTVPISHPVAMSDLGDTAILSSPMPAASPTPPSEPQESEWEGELERESKEKAAAKLIRDDSSDEEEVESAEIDEPAAVSSEPLRPARPRRAARRVSTVPESFVLGGEIGAAPTPVPPPPAATLGDLAEHDSDNARANDGSGLGWDLEPDAGATHEGEGYGYGESDGGTPSEVVPLHAPGSQLRLTIANLLPQKTLRELQDTFWASSRHPAFILDADGRPVVGSSPFVLDAKANLILQHLIDPATVPHNGPVMFPIIADGQRVGSVAFDPRHLPIPFQIYREKLAKYIVSKGVKQDDIASVMRAAERVFAPHAGTAASMAISLANQLSRLCEQEVALRERIEELGTLGHMTTLLAGERDLSHRLNAAVRSAVAVLNVKAACIRIFDDASNTLKVAAAYNLSREYMSQVLNEAEASPITKAAFAGETVFIDDLSTDSRVVYQTRAVEEGLVSGMVVGLLYRNKPVGTFHVYTGDYHVFSRSASKLFASIARLTASAIENSRRDAEVAENQRVQRQLKLATDVQRRMLPRTNPTIPGFEIDARYVPSFEIGGDFYDFIQLGPNLGIAVGDVAGKGIAAGLLMAGVRASLRAYAQDLYDIDQVMSRVNRSLASDTLPSEFATVFFGVLDPVARRLTYCNAGHEPPFLLRDGQITKLEDGGMVVGVDPEGVYRRGIADLQPGDLLLFYTDGLPDAQNFDRKRFTKDRVLAALLECANLSAKEAVSHMLWQMRRFAGMNHPTDDTTIVVIRVTG